MRQGTYQGIEALGKGSMIGSFFYTIWSALICLALIMLTLPVWWVPPLVAILPPLLWGWLTMRLMSYDVLLKHATTAERDILLERYRWELLGMGVAAGMLGAVPTFFWATSALALVLSFAIANPVTAQGSQTSIKSKAFVEIEPIPKFIGKAAVKKQKYKKTEMLGNKELKGILYYVGFRGERLKQAWAVAKKESTGRPRSHNKNPDTGDNSYGLFQINMIDSLGPARRKQFNLKSNEDLFDPIRNAKIAYIMSNKGKNWSSWNGITDRTIYWMSKFPDKS
jgi:hypothetical protein